MPERGQLFQGAYGPMTDFEDILAWLRSPDPAVHEAALESLSEDLYHQRTLYPATPLAIPFLIALLQEHDLSSKSNILYFLRDLAEPVISSEDDSVYRERATQTLDALKQGKLVFEHVAEEKDIAVQRAAKGLLYILFEGGTINAW